MDTKHTYNVDSCTKGETDKLFYSIKLKNEVTIYNHKKIDAKTMKLKEQTEIDFSSGIY